MLRKNISLVLWLILICIFTACGNGTANASNSWAYTRLGKINLSQEELEKLLSNGDVTITLGIN